jgi:succinate dehydrogenase flavin-adding protein (antitoxin of CptAB toxin-antitoxin module)
MNSFPPPWEPKAIRLSAGADTKNGVQGLLTPGGGGGGEAPSVIMQKDIEIRRLRYLARRRSTLELDQVLGLIADRMDMESLSEAELVELARIIELDDFSLQKALLGKRPVPEGIDSAMWGRVLDVIRKGPDIRQMLLGDH